MRPRRPRHPRPAAPPRRPAPPTPRRRPIAAAGLAPRRRRRSTKSARRSAGAPPISSALCQRHGLGGELLRRHDRPRHLDRRRPRRRSSTSWPRWTARPARRSEPIAATARGGMEAETSYRDAVREALLHRFMPGVHRAARTRPRVPRAVADRDGEGRAGTARRPHARHVEDGGGLGALWDARRRRLPLDQRLPGDPRQRREQDAARGLRLHAADLHRLGAPGDDRRLQAGAAHPARRRAGSAARAGKRRVQLRHHRRGQGGLCARDLRPDRRRSPGRR